MATAGEVLLQSSPVTAESSERAPSGAKQFHVLAVDDSLMDRKLVERLLDVSSFKVTAVESAKRALQFLGLDGERSCGGSEGLEVNLIMTDYSMPGMTGYELLKKIKGSTAFREIPVVIMSSEKIVARIERCLEEGAQEFIVKPVKLSDVKRLRDFVMGGARGENREKGNGKRKLQDDYNLLSHSTQSSPLPPPPSFGSNPFLRHPSSSLHSPPKQPKLGYRD